MPAACSLSDALARRTRPAQVRGTLAEARHRTEPYVEEARHRTDAARRWLAANYPQVLLGLLAPPLLYYAMRLFAPALLHSLVRAVGVWAPTWILAALLAAAGLALGPQAAREYGARSRVVPAVDEEGRPLTAEGEPSGGSAARETSTQTTQQQHKAGGGGGGEQYGARGGRLMPPQAGIDPDAVPPAGPGAEAGGQQHEQQQQRAVRPQEALRSTDQEPRRQQYGQQHYTVS